ncbi:MAG: hypothetical protein PHF33_04880 [Candidatus Delongbacteria bacterium]|nr:hypothetical protein [Candidatus Delongbacteria bacterium]MDD4204771.1 hypothetical protein [Candidatus Delongbacteria bacterium]
MKKIIFSFIILQAGLLIAGLEYDPIAIGSVSFKDAVWDKNNNILYSTQEINSLTKDNRAIILYLFEACFG